jgi:Tfp pilus assembly protein PilV
MIEVLVASIVLLVTMIPMGLLLTHVSGAAADARQRQAALQLADSWIEILSNSQPPTNTDGSVLTNGRPQTPTAPAGTQPPPTTLAGTTYAVTAGYTENLVNNVGQAGQSDLCSAGQPPSQSHPGVIQLKVTVSWDGGARTLSDTTEINYPKPGLQTEGFLAINVTNDGEADSNGNDALSRIQALPVTVTQVTGPPPTGTINLSPNPYTLYPDNNGCIFAQVPVGTYNVAILQPTAGTPASFAGFSGAPPFVNPSGSTAQEIDGQNVTVTAEQTVNLGAFDQGITSDISYGGASAVDAGVTCPGTTSIPCVTFGDGPSGASAAWGGGTTNWSSTTLAPGSRVNAVDCTTAVHPYCIGVGYGTTGGTIATTPSDLNSLAYDTLPPGVTDLTQAACLSDRGCYAVGLSTTGPVLLAGSVGNSGDRWIKVLLPGVTVTSLGSIACPTSNTCELGYQGVGSVPGVIRLDGDPGTMGGNPSWAPTVTTDVLPPVVTSVGTLTCPTTTTCLAVATGDPRSPSDATVITVPVAASGPSTWTSETSFPTGASTVTGLSCTATTCVAIGTATGAAAVWTGSLDPLGDNWSQATGFPGPTVVAAVTSVTCGNPSAGDTADCAVGAVSASPSGGALLYDGSLAGSWAWNRVTIPAGDNLQYVVGVSCGTPPAAATCAAVGATQAGPVVLTSTTGPGGTWSDNTPLSSAGEVVAGIPLETAPSGTSSWTPQVPSGGTTNATTLPTILYPQAPGYSIAAGDCPVEATSTAIANLNAPPGGSADVTVPLGLLPLQLVGPTGAPVSGATITLTSTQCGGTDSYNLPVTDATGITMASVPYGTFSYTVTQGSSAVAHTSVTIVVGASTVVVSTAGSPVTDFLPGLAQVQA